MNTVNEIYSLFTLIEPWLYMIIIPTITDRVDSIRILFLNSRVKHMFIIYAVLNSLFKVPTYLFVKELIYNIMFFCKP